MATSHLDSSAAARPASLGRTPDLTSEDVDAVVAVLASSPDAMVSPERDPRPAAPLRETVRYVVTRAEPTARRGRFRALLDARSTVRRR